MEMSVIYCPVCGKAKRLSMINPTVNAAAGNYTPIYTNAMTTNAWNYPAAIVQHYPQAAAAAGVWMPSWDMCICH